MCVRSQFRQVFWLYGDADQLKPFFTTLKGAKKTVWNKECDQDFMAIKQYLSEPPILDSLKAYDMLYLYLAVSDVSVSANFFKEDEKQKQRPVFFVRKSLSEVDTQYTRLEQAALALYVAAQKLHPYFEAHPIIILTNLLLRSTIHKPNLSEGWLVGLLS